MIKKLRIKGLRGFATYQDLRLAEPKGTPGSGLTIIVGANNSGKSTVIEAFRAVSQVQPPGFTQGRRNPTAGDKVDISVTDSEGRTRHLRSIRRGGSETEFGAPDDGSITSSIFILPSRRTFVPYFSRGLAERQRYRQITGFPNVRSSSVDQFSQRLFVAERNQNEFNQVLGKVLSPVPDWSIDQLDSGQYFLKVNSGTSSHSSEGLGEGLVSLFFIIDALYDSEEGACIVMDEPELSLHPHLQRKLGQLLTEYASDRQIVVSTHSPYFVNLEALANGASVARVFQKNNKSRISQISKKAARNIAGLLRNYNNPHVFGLKAQEVFFLEDHVLLVEGQEDVVHFDHILDQLSRSIAGVFYGWGVGGAGNMKHIAAVLRDFGFERVVGILDRDQVHLLQRLRRAFPKFHFESIPADDVRTKSRRVLKRKVGLLDKHGVLRREHVKPLNDLLDRVDTYLR